MLKLKNGTSMIIPAAFNSGGGNQEKPVNHRALFIQGLKDMNMQKRSQNFTIDRLKSTFVQTELTNNPGLDKKARAEAFFKSRINNTVTEANKNADQETAGIV